MPTYLKGCLKEPDPPSQTPYFYILSLKYIELGSLDFSTVVFHPVLQLVRCYYQIDGTVENTEGTQPRGGLNTTGTEL